MYIAGRIMPRLMTGDRYWSFIMTSIILISQQDMINGFAAGIEKQSDLWQ